jgi:glycosyltransferase involved in cell wall biosynthesis
MKICVYTIAKNEEKFVKRWAESCSEADYRIICDTGSTDKTVEIAKNCGVTVHSKKFKVWRFDKARNWSLSCIPEDVDMCIALDMDEVLLPGWRAALENIESDVTRPRYKYVWSWDQDGSEGLVYSADKIHTRNGYKWSHPVHEVLTPTKNEKQAWVNNLIIHHYPDHEKSRSQYLPLLELAVKEKPKDDRNQFYLAREYFFNNKNELAIKHFKLHLELSTWTAERAASCRYLSKIDLARREHWIFRAIAEDSSRRESWVELAQYYYDFENWTACQFASSMALKIKKKPLDYLCDSDSWGWKPHDLMAISSYWLEDYENAYKHGAMAYKLRKYDERLEKNLKFYKSKINLN